MRFKEGDAIFHPKTAGRAKFLFYTPHDPKYVAQIRMRNGSNRWLYPGELEEFELEMEPNPTLTKKLRALRKLHPLDPDNVWLQVGDVFQPGDKILGQNEVWSTVSPGDLHCGREISESDLRSIPQGISIRQSKLPGNLHLVHQPGHGFSAGTRIRQLNSSECRYVETISGDSVAALWGAQEVHRVESEDYFVVGPLRERAKPRRTPQKAPPLPEKEPGRRKFDLDA